MLYITCGIKYFNRNKITLVFSTENTITASYTSIYCRFAGSVTSPCGHAFGNIHNFFFFTLVCVYTREAYTAGNENVGHRHCRRALISIVGRTELQNRVFRAPCISSRVESPAALQMLVLAHRIASRLERLPPSCLNYPTLTAARI